jgi:putative spermidine/putrescine transport system permease protein
MTVRQLEREPPLRPALKARLLKSWKRKNETALLILPAALVFVAFFLVPVVLLLAIAFNPSIPGLIDLQSTFTLENFQRFFSFALYYGSLLRVIVLGVIVAALAFVLGYPLAFVIARTRHPWRNAVLMILVLVSLQLDIVIRVYGLMITLGDNGLVNDFLRHFGLITDPLPLMYNGFGVVVGLLQFTLPFMVLSLIGIIRSIDPSLEEAARSLGASRWKAFFTIILPLSVPGILAGFVLVFALVISSYVVPVLMGGWRVVVPSMHIYQQIAELGNWQFGAAAATLLFAISLVAVYVYNRLAARYVGGMI